MPEYQNIDPKIAGLKQGLGSRVRSLNVKEIAGIAFGLPVFGYEGNENDIFKYHNNQAQIVWDADFVTSNLIDIVVDGVAVTQVPFNTDQATTIQDVCDQIEADITGAVCVRTDTGGDDRTITITIEDGVDRVVTEVVTAGASQATGTITVASTQIFVGFTMITHIEAAAKTDLDGNVVTAATAFYAFKSVANIMIDGWLSAVTGAAVSSYKDAYVVATGVQQGNITDVSASNVLLSGVTFVETVAAAGLANIRILK